MNILPFKAIDVLATFTKVLTGTKSVWKGSKPSPKQRVYFANHTSNLDTILIWSALPAELRATTRPVAAKDYWDQEGVRRYVATKELNVVFVERNAETRTENPLNPLRQALDEGSSLIIFPEGKRGADIVPGEFKTGVYRLAKEYPHVEFIPIYLENVSKTFPRGAFFPLPIICKVYFGAPFDFNGIKSDLEAKEHGNLCVEKARQAIINLMPTHLKALTVAPIYVSDLVEEEAEEPVESLKSIEEEHFVPETCVLTDPTSLEQKVDSVDNHNGDFTQDNLVQYPTNSLSPFVSSKESGVESVEDIKVSPIVETKDK